MSDSFYEAFWSSRVYNYASHDDNIRVALSSLHFNIIELVLMA